MAGNTGSPLCAELNRIANYGVYPDRDDFLEEQGAANVWAGTTGQGLLGALNYIVDPTRTDDRFSDLTKVCNELASTTGLSDVDALRTINHPAEVLLRGTTPQSAVWSVDASDSGFLYLPGVAGNYATSPDSPILDITGDIDLRCKVALTNWIPGSANVLIAKRNVNVSYQLYINGTTGTIGIIYSIDGTIALQQVSTVAPTVRNGETLWVRATRVASTGIIQFFTSTDNIVWTQLGADVASTPGSIYSSAEGIEIGARTGGTQLPAQGKIFRAQVLNGINGTVVFDANFETSMTSQALTSFTESSGNNATVTINRTNYSVQPNVLDNFGKASSLLPVTIGSSLAADTNDPILLSHTGTNYVYTTGVAGNGLSIPDNAAFDITGDIDLRVQVALDSWTTAQSILTKWGNAGGRSYELTAVTTGYIGLYWTSDGTTTIGNQSTAVIPFAAGTTGWIRATLSVASNYALNFYTSTNGTTWTQLGTTVTGVGATSIFSSTTDVTIGQRGNTGLPTTGKIFRAQILNGINGTTVLDVDTSVITTGAATSFTAVTGQTVTINRATGGRKTVAVTQPTYLFGSDDYMEVNNRYMSKTASSENYVYLSGSTSNYMSIPDAAPLDITGDIDLRVKVAMDDWTPGSSRTLLSKYNTGQQSYAFNINSSNRLAFIWTEDGSTVLSKQSTVNPTVADGATLWVRTTLDVDNGAGGYDVKFFTSTDGTTWTQLGTTVTTAGTTSLYSGTATINIGSNTNGVAAPSRGAFYRAQILNGINGTVVLDADASVITLPSQTTFVDRSSNAYTVTINKSGVGTFVSTGNYLYFPGTATNSASAPDATALDITGNIDIRAKAAMDDWTPSAIAVLIAKWTATGNQRSYRLDVNTNGTLTLFWSADGVTSSSATSTVSPTVADGQTLWVRATLSVASNYAVIFYTSTDGLTWTQLGTTVTGVGATSIFNSTSILEIGALSGGANFRGKFFRAQVLNGIGGTVAFDANFEESITSFNQASFTESSTNGATVSINRAGSLYRVHGIVDAGYLYPGGPNTFANSTTSFLDFGATDNFTVLWVGRQWTTLGGNGGFVSKTGGGVAQPVGWSLATNRFVVNSDGANNSVTESLTVTSGTLSSVVGIRNTTTDLIVKYINGVVGTYAADNTTGTLSNIGTLRINGQGSLYNDTELYGAAVFRGILTTKNLADIQNYFQGRD